MEKRKVNEETIQTWQIGYAPGPPAAGWREVKDALEAKSYTKNELLQTGLIKTTEGGKEPFDVFRDRIMFPMNDSSGKVVAFSGRLLGANDKAPKNYTKNQNFCMGTTKPSMESVSLIFHLLWKVSLMW